MSNNPLIDISKVYMEEIAETAQTEAYTVTRADKEGNTPAYQGLKAGKKNVKTGKPLYKAADHLKDDKDYGYDKDGNSLNPADIEAKKRKEDKLFGSPNKKVKKEEVEVDEGIGRAIKKVKRIAKRVGDSFDDDPGRAHTIGTLGNPHSENEDKRAAERKAGKKVKKEAISNWREDLKHIVEVVDEPEEKAEKEIKEKTVNNKVIINPNFKEAVKEIGGELLEVTELSEKDKDTPDQVKAVIAYDKARKGTRDATYDTMHGDKEQAKKERDYAKWQRDQGAEFAQKSGHRWKHAPGSTREKEGKKSVKHAHVQDSYDPQREEELWYGVAERLTELGEMRNVQYKVEGYQRNPEEGERKEREANRKYEKVRGERTPMPPRGNKRREDFERWYAANVR